ncbi:MAG: adenylosuccinate synthetase [Gelidibacter sp.]
MLNILTPLLLQKPSATPNPGSNSSIDFSTPFDVIVFIILPIIIIILYVYWRRSKKM